MAIRKPSWLKEWLNTLNWDILKWKVYVGNAVEEGFDWALDWINDAVSRAESAWERAGVAWDKAVSVGKELGKTISKEVGKLWDALDTWWDDLGDWWATKRALILDWIDELKDDVLDWLKGFVSLDWFRSWWGSTKLTFKDWWDATWKKVLDAFEVVVAPVRDEVNRHTAVLELIKEFIDDPLEWLWHRFSDWFLGEE